MNRPYTSMIIPAYNEEEAIALVLRDLPQRSVDDLIVADNASTDATAIVAEAHGARVVRESRRGYGAACLAGIAALNPSTEIVVFMDGDYSDHAGDLPALMKPLLDGSAELVIGTRTAWAESRQALSIPQRWGNWLATRLIGMRWHHRYTDLGPFRAITRPALEKIGMTDRNFGWTVEMQIKAIRAGLRIVEVPVRYRRRIVGQSKISGTVSGTIMAGAKILYVIGKYAWS